MGGSDEFQIEHLCHFARIGKHVSDQDTFMIFNCSSFCGQIEDKL